VALTIIIADRPGERADDSDTSERVKLDMLKFGNSSGREEVAEHAFLGEDG
jgi:hypothetical protein